MGMNSSYCNESFLLGIPYIIETSETEFGDSGRINFRDLPVFYVVTNFVISNITALNAPIRQIPMTQKSHQPIPLLGTIYLILLHCMLLITILHSKKQAKISLNLSLTTTQETMKLPSIRFY